jgi:hypothetical protein
MSPMLRKATGSTLRTEEGLFCKNPGGGAAHAQCSGLAISGQECPRLAESEGEQARAKQHKTGCGYRKEAFGYKIIVTHGAPANRDSGPN